AMSGRLATSPLSARARARTAVRAASFSLSLAPRPPSRPAIEGFFSVIHVPNHGVPKPRATHQRGARNQQLQILFHVLACGQLTLRRAKSLTQPRKVIRQL